MIQPQPDSRLRFRSRFASWRVLLVVCVALAVISCATTADAIAFNIGSNFSDGSLFNPSGFIPPDTMGAVGPNHVAVMINGQYAVYTRAGVQQQSISLNTFWTNALAVSTTGTFDPRILYDSFNDRWFAASCDNGGAANNFLLAVSNTNNPTGAWTGFKIDADTDNVEWADFPTMGMNNSVIALSANMFPIAAGSSSTTQLVVPKADLLQAVPTVANRTLFQNTNPNNTGFSVQPAVDLTNGGLSLPLLSSYNKPAGSLKVSSIAGTANAPVLITAGGFVSVTARGTPPTIDQPGAKTNIDASDNRFSGNVIIQQTPGRLNKSLWGVHTVSQSGRAALEWYEIDAVTNALLQNGVISDPVLAFNYPSIAVNANGIAVIGFSGGSPSTFMSTYVAVGETLAGVTTFGATTLTKAGVSDYQRLDSINRNRWGDYSATVLDPAEPTAFWTIQEFVSATDVWRIQVTQIRVPEPSALALVACVLVSLSGMGLGRRKR